MSTLNGKQILVIGARADGYGASIARAAVEAGARVFGTSLTPADPREQAFFEDLGVTLLEVPLRFDVDRRTKVFHDLVQLEESLRALGVDRLDAVIHAIAGGFPRQPSVMKAVGDILKGEQTFSDMATAVKRDVYYVNATSFADTVTGLSGLIDDQTHLLALTYRGELPYFIADTKRYLERLAVRLARRGKRTLIAALPEAWTQSSQFFTGIEIAVMHNFLQDLRGEPPVSDDLAEAFSDMKGALGKIDGLGDLFTELQLFMGKEWSAIAGAGDPEHVFVTVQGFLGRLRNEGTLPILRSAVEVVSDFVRRASGIITIREFIARGRYEAGEVRQLHYKDLTGRTTIGTARPREKKVRPPVRKREWVTYEKDEIRKTLSMYGDNFLFLDRVIMETGDLRDGGMGFGSFTVPSPSQNPIMKDHFVGMPLFGGHLQMEAVAQFGTFMILKCVGERKLVPILTGTEFPDLNTMAPPGEKLAIMGVIRLQQKRRLSLEAFIENRYARSRGIIRGMLVGERVVRKMMSSFTNPDPAE